MRAEYSVNLLNDGHGVWLFVSKNGKVVTQRNGIKNPSEALKLATSVIESEETHEAQRKEAEEEASRVSASLDGR
jgi:hypothetical protein